MRKFKNKKGKSVPGMYHESLKKQDGGTAVGNFIRSIIPSNVPYSIDAEREAVRNKVQERRFPDYSCDPNNPDKCAIVDQQIDSWTDMMMRNAIKREKNPTGRIARAQELESKGRYRRANRLRNKDKRKRDKIASEQIKKFLT